MKCITCRSFHYLQAVEQTADGALLLLHVQTHLSDHGPQQYNRLSGGSLQLLHHLWTAEGREVHGRYKTRHQLHWHKHLVGQSYWKSSKDCHKCADEWARLLYQNSLVQHLTALHVCRLNVNAVGSALPAVNDKRVIRSNEQRSTCAAHSLTLACLWNTWCRAETCSLSRTGCRAPRGELRGQRCRLMQSYGLFFNL